MLLGLDTGAKRKEAVLKELPPIPRTGWKPPTYFPDLRGATLMSFDTETKDLNLLTNGPGWGRKQGHIVGLSIAAIASNNERWCGYFPIRHEVETHLNQDVNNVLSWARDMLQTPTIPKTGANLSYDVGWLAEENINVQGKLYDVQYAEALLDEQNPTNLEHLGRKYLGVGKSSAGLYDWLSRAYGGPATHIQRRNIYRAPPSLVGFYGESDAALPLDILHSQWWHLANEDLLELYEMECKLTRLLVRMRQTGVRVDVPYAERLYDELGKNIYELQEQFAHKWGQRANANSSQQLGPIFEAQGIKVPRTPPSATKPNGEYSIIKDWLKGIAEDTPEDEPSLARDVLLLREFDKMRSTFVRGYILEGNVNGRLHCSFNPLRVSKGDTDDSKGAKTGRFSSSDPNLQNIPIRTDLGKRIRNAFIADISHLAWAKFDYSQIEYRMLAHFAVDSGDGSADALRLHYTTDPDADYHDVVYDRVCEYMGWDINDKALRKVKRRPIKNTNFGLLYGQGQNKLSRTMGFTPEQSRQFFDAYHSGAPYVKPTMQMCADEVHRNGFVQTILKRRTRFNLWQPDTGLYDKNKAPMPVGYDLALAKWGPNLRRAYDYRAVNYKFQGSAADIMKKAMVDLDESGVFDVLGVPKLTVHDELDFSLPDGSRIMREALRYVKHRMEIAIPLRVPVRTDPEFGKAWGYCG
jgi:DNA polymerase I-like protein with 3'-5' exonuclease and polymerase domains